MRERAHMLFIMRQHRVPEPVQRLTQRRAPLLVPPAVIANFTSAIRSPALYSVRAAPRGVLQDLDLVGRREFFQIFAVDGHPREIVGSDMMRGNRPGPFHRNCDDGRKSRRRWRYERAEDGVGRAEKRPATGSRN